MLVAIASVSLAVQRRSVAGRTHHRLDMDSRPVLTAAAISLLLGTLSLLLNREINEHCKDITYFKFNIYF